MCRLGLRISKQMGERIYAERSLGNYDGCSIKKTESKLCRLRVRRKAGETDAWRCTEEDSAAQSKHSHHNQIIMSL